MIYFSLDDSYEDITGATLDILHRNTYIYNLPINESVAYFMNEFEGLFKENPFEKIITLIPVGVFLIEHNFKYKILEDVEFAIKEIESKNYNNLFLYSEDIDRVLKDIKFIKDNIKRLK